MEKITIDKQMNDASLIHWLDSLIRSADTAGASDIHFESYENHYRIRVRLDGLLSEIANPDLSLGARIIARLKVMSNLDISEKRIPQDGRFKWTLGLKTLTLRISTCPTLFGEKVVIRLLNSTQENFEINRLGFSKNQELGFLNALKKNQGMILVTGPTGSGKTMTLYTALNLLNCIEKNISTVEDPVEMHLAGINQVQVNAKAGLNFALSLRAFLRQDPDVITVGEIRDLETASIAMNASHTGHSVLSTLHTNGAIETLIRLHHMGVETFTLANAVHLIIAQRLIRLICTQCKEKKEDGTYKAIGCTTCHQGYKGRIGIFELLPISSKINLLISQKADIHTIENQAKTEGFLDLKHHALEKVKEGLTTLEEAYRVLGEL